MSKLQSPRIDRLFLRPTERVTSTSLVPYHTVLETQGCTAMYRAVENADKKDPELVSPGYLVLLGSKGNTFVTALFKAL